MATQMPQHDHVMSTADQELAHTLKNEFLDLCLKRTSSALVALSAARCAAECFESIINEQGGEVFTVNSPSDFEQLTRLREVSENLLTALDKVVVYAPNVKRAADALREALAQRRTKEKS